MSTLYRIGDLLLTPDGFLLVALPDHLADLLPRDDAPFDPMAMSTGRKLSFFDDMGNCYRTAGGGADIDLPYGCRFAGVASDRATWAPEVTKEAIIKICFEAEDGCRACIDEGYDPDAYLADIAGIQSVLMSLPD